MLACTPSVVRRIGHAFGGLRNKAKGGCDIKNLTKIALEEVAMNVPDVIAETTQPS